MPQRLVANTKVVVSTLKGRLNGLKRGQVASPEDVKRSGAQVLRTFSDGRYAIIDALPDAAPVQPVPHLGIGVQRLKRRARRVRRHVDRGRQYREQVEPAIGPQIPDFVDAGERLPRAAITIAIPSIPTGIITSDA